MQIVDHLIQVSEPDGIDFRLKLDPPNDYGGWIVPLGFLLHYSVTPNLAVLDQVIRDREYVNSAVGVDAYGDGERATLKMTQYVPLNRRAYHAGKDSVWRGRKECNGFLIGIEVANPGPLEKHNGKLYPTWDKKRVKPWEGPVVQAKHPNPKCPWEFWVPYEDEEYELIIHFMATCARAYPTIMPGAVAGHHEVAPGRKFDPGPCANLDILSHAVWPSVPRLDPYGRN